MADTDTEKNIGDGLFSFLFFFFFFFLPGVGGGGGGTSCRVNLPAKIEDVPEEASQSTLLGVPFNKIYRCNATE